ncbi:hypothetical protein CesoFtcFv8_013467 [Champsocephalus esox]|uniref:Uncharacterized protein n=1 Tax=Champsocephalus esox TaxID=159716 RepID=A0AAN8BQV2_9TELE|nr:hypothetical protein CesoFtcFv8_013467 [Champsocephalus esox]
MKDCALLGGNRQTRRKHPADLDRSLLSVNGLRPGGLATHSEAGASEPFPSRQDESARCLNKLRRRSICQFACLRSAK